jgi:L-asparaginase
MLILGTDALIEVANHLQHTLKTEKTVVITGAMRMGSSFGADGISNVVCSLKLLVDPVARGLEEWLYIVMSEQILPASFTTKLKASSLGGFHSFSGALGIFQDSKPLFFELTNKRYYDIRDYKGALPKVDILYGHPEVDPEIFLEAVDRGAKGIVLAGMGLSSWTSSAGAKILPIIEKRDVVVVVSRREGFGYTNGQGAFGLGDICIGSGFRDASKSRVELQILLAAGLDWDGIKKAFECTRTGRQCAECNVL